MVASHVSNTFSIVVIEQLVLDVLHVTVPWSDLDLPVNNTRGIAVHFVPCPGRADGKVSIRVRYPAFDYIKFIGSYYLVAMAVGRKTIR